MKRQIKSRATDRNGNVYHRDDRGVITRYSLKLTGKDRRRARRLARDESFLESPDNVALNLISHSPLQDN